MLFRKFILVCKLLEIRHKTKCLKRVNPGRPCKFNKQCLGGSKCKNKFCKCKNDEGVKHDLCVKSKANSRLEFYDE